MSIPNTNKLEFMREKYIEQHFIADDEGNLLAKPTSGMAEHMVVLSTINALLRVANHTRDLDEIETLTRAGRLIAEQYERAYTSRND